MALDLDKVEVEALRADASLGGFDSRDPDLNEFLATSAKLFQQIGIGVTHLALYEGQLVGYFTLASASIRVREMAVGELIQGAERLEHYPAVLVGRLAVDRRFEHQGLGSLLLQMIYGLAVQARERIAVRFLLINATQNSLKWWTDRGFRYVGDQTGRKQPFMFIDIERMEQAPRAQS